jgi:hypothetical protein
MMMRSSEVLAYYVDQSKTRVCAKDVAGETEASLQFTGLGMAKDHAFFEYNVSPVSGSPSAAWH